MKQYDAHSILIVSTANGLRERENNEIQINGDTGE